jgi:hypothetical protein
MSLDIIWEESLVHTGKLYRPQVDPNSDGGGTPGNRGWVVVAAAFEYLNYSTQNFSQPSSIGRILEPSSISVQWGYSTPDCPWKEADIILDQTPGGLLFGLAFRILGPPTQYDAMPRGIAESAFSKVELRQEPHVPEGLPA